MCEVTATAAQVFGAGSGHAIIAEHERLEALQVLLGAIFADAIHLHGLQCVRIMRYAGALHGHHLAVFEGEKDLFVAAYDLNFALRFVQRERDHKILWEAE